MSVHGTDQNKEICGQSGNTCTFLSGIMSEKLCSILPDCTRAVLLNTLIPAVQAGNCEVSADIDNIRISAFVAENVNAKTDPSAGLADNTVFQAFSCESLKPVCAGNKEGKLIISVYITDAPKAVCSNNAADAAEELKSRLLVDDAAAEVLNDALEVQSSSRAICRISGSTLTVTYSSRGDNGAYFRRICRALRRAGLTVAAAQFSKLTAAAGSEILDRQSVDQAKFEIVGNIADAAALTETIQTLYFCCDCDIYHRELVEKHGFTVSEAMLIRAAAEFVHNHFAFIDRYAYSDEMIAKQLVIYPDILRSVLADFAASLAPFPAEAAGNTDKLTARINSGIAENDRIARNIHGAVIDFFAKVLKTNYFCKNKGALSFRMDPAFMDFYANLSDLYTSALPSTRPFAVFFFARCGAVGYQVRFSEIARGGWRTVIPRCNENAIEKFDLYDAAKDEIFREGYVLAHTQHLKNKDIYEGGSKMIALLKMQQNYPLARRNEILWEAQKAIFEAFMTLISYDQNGKIKAADVVDKTGFREIIEIGPDENMFDCMIEYMGEYAAKNGYTLGAGVISGKPGCGINHKHYGVTSFGVHQYLLRTMKEFNVDPTVDEHSIKISGGPAGDVAGNLMKILLQKDASGKALYPKMRITAITDGPAAVSDPAGIDPDALSELVLCKDLAAFPAEKLRGENAYIVYSTPITENGSTVYRQYVRSNGQLVEKHLTRDEFMQIFQNNLCPYADFFLPCGGRPSTINGANWEKFTDSCKAIVEGANSFNTPEARIKLQESGILIVKDASANKCGVITSSYEILSGLMLNEDEFQKEKDILIPQVLEKLAFHARREAEWLFTSYKKTGKMMTDLTEELSWSINRKNDEMMKKFAAENITPSDDIILGHLPEILRTKYAGRISRIPLEYRRAIAAVEAASAEIYNS